MDAKFIGKSKLTRQGQITLPQEARRSMGIPNDSELYWYEISNALVLVRDLVSQKELTKFIFSPRKKR